MRSFGQNPIRISNPKMDFLIPWANPKTGFESIEPTLRKDSIDLNQMWIFLDLKSKASIENGFEKCTHGQRCLANNIVPSFGVGGGGGGFSVSLKTTNPKNS